MAAPSGLTRLTASLCVEPLPTSRRGGAVFRRLRFRLFLHDRLLDDDGLDRLLVLRLRGRNLVDGLLRLLVEDFAEGGVLAVEKRRRLMADEELRAGGVR